MEKIKNEKNYVVTWKDEEYAQSFYFDRMRSRLVEMLLTMPNDGERTGEDATRIYDRTRAVCDEMLLFTWITKSERIPGFWLADLYEKDSKIFRFITLTEAGQAGI